MGPSGRTRGLKGAGNHREGSRGIRGDGKSFKIQATTRKTNIENFFKLFNADLPLWQIPSPPRPKKAADAPFGPLAKMAGEAIQST